MNQHALPYHLNADLLKQLFNIRTQRGLINIALAFVTLLFLVPLIASAATTGAAFQPAYQFIDDAATGYLGRGIAITGGVIGLGTGAATGKALPASIGVVLGIFGALGPGIADTIFNAAIV